jgi:hypothetical protein
MARHSGNRRSGVRARPHHANHDPSNRHDIAQFTGPDATSLSWLARLNSTLFAWLSRPAVCALAGSALLACFVAYLVVQHWMVFAYYDDWGMAVLDFHMVKVEGFDGRQFSAGQAFEFLSKFYTLWGGRVVPFAIQIYAFKLGGVDAPRAIQVCAIAALVVLTAGLATHRRPVTWALAVPIVLYLAIPLFVAARGMYWFSHSSHSLWSVPLLLLGLWRYSTSGSITTASAILFAAAAICNEQMAAATLATMATLLALDWRRGWARTSAVRQVALCAPAVCAACFVVLAPGNFARASVETYKRSDLVEHAWTNLTQLSDLVMRRAPSRAYLYAWGASLMCLLLLHLAARGRRSTAIAAGVCALIVAGAYWLPGPCALAAMIAASAALASRLLSLDGSRISLALICGSAAALVPLVASPAIYPRSLLTFYVLLFTPICWSFASLARSGRWGWSLAAISLVLLAVPAASNAYGIYLGYARDCPIHQANERALERASRLQRLDPSWDPRVEYYMLPSIQFAELMPYQREFIEAWIKKYYSLPPEVKFEYLPPERFRDPAGRGP